MVAITRSSGSYALIAPVSLKPNAEALRKVAEAAGNSISTTTTSLTTQQQDLSRFVNKVAKEIDPVAALETTRGLNLSADISAQVSDAVKAIQQRFVGTQARNSSRPNTSSGSTAGAALVAVLKAAANGDDVGFDFSALLTKTNSKVKPNEISITAAKQDKPDVFDRGIPLTAAVGGAATLSVKKAALAAQVFDVPLDKSNPDLGGIERVGYAPEGAARSGNEGFYVKGDTGKGDDTVVFDTRDTTGEDTRLTSIDLKTGDGSDVIFIAGENVSRIDAGAGDDFVAVEGDAVVNGGEGNDLIFARTASGDAGDDVIYSDGFASGGEGNDTIVLFSLDAQNDENAKLAFGGAGNDTIVASVKADVDGGEGNDAIILRDGGTAGGGEGDDRISAWANATVEGGAGNDDILLLLGGQADGGDGDDRIEANYYASASGGKGADTVSLKGGGTYTFAKGDGADTVEIGKALAQRDDANKTPVNRVVIDGYAYGDLTTNVDLTSLTFTPTGLNVGGDKLSVDREVLGKIEVVFRKNGQQQTLTIDGLTQTLGALGPVTP